MFRDPRTMIFMSSHTRIVTPVHHYSNQSHHSFLSTQVMNTRVTTIGCGVRLVPSTPSFRSASASTPTETLATSGPQAGRPWGPAAASTTGPSLSLSPRPEPSGTSFSPTKTRWDGVNNGCRVLCTPHPLPSPMHDNFSLHIGYFPDSLNISLSTNT